MSVLIKGMKKPKSCDECPLADSYMACDAQSINCPIIEVPTPHGRLIDADALEQEMINGIKAGNYEDGYDDYPNINNMDDCVECVRYADIIIEAEKGANNENL